MIQSKNNDRFNVVAEAAADNILDFSSTLRELQRMWTRTSSAGVKAGATVMEMSRWSIMSNGTR